MAVGDWTRILRQVEKLVEDDNQIVHFKSLAHAFSINVDLSKRILFAFFEKHWRNCDVVFHVNGVSASDSKRKIQFIEQDQLQKSLEQYNTITSLHVYCVGPKNSISRTSFLNSKTENLHVITPHPNTVGFLYAIQHELELQSFDEPMQIDKKEQNFSNIKEETSAPNPHRSPEAERKTDVKLRDQKEMVLSPNKRQVIDRTIDDPEEESQLKRRKANNHTSHKSKKASIISHPQSHSFVKQKKSNNKVKSELEESAQTVHKRVVRRTINEKGEEVLEEDCTPLEEEDSRQTQMEAIKSSFGGVKTRASTKQASLKSYFNDN